MARPARRVPGRPLSAYMAPCGGSGSRWIRVASMRSTFLTLIFMKLSRCQAEPGERSPADETMLRCDPGATVRTKTQNRCLSPDRMARCVTGQLLGRAGCSSSRQPLCRTPHPHTLCTGVRLHSCKNRRLACGTGSGCRRCVSFMRLRWAWLARAASPRPPLRRSPNAPASRAARSSTTTRPRRTRCWARRPRSCPRTRSTGSCRIPATTRSLRRCAWSSRSSPRPARWISRSGSTAGSSPSSPLSRSASRSTSRRPKG